MPGSMSAWRGSLPVKAVWPAGAVVISRARGCSFSRSSSRRSTLSGAPGNAAGKLSLTDYAPFGMQAGARTVRGGPWGAARISAPPRMNRAFRIFMRSTSAGFGHWPLEAESSFPTAPLWSIWPQSGRAGTDRDGRRSGSINPCSRTDLGLAGAPGACNG